MRPDVKISLKVPGPRMHKMHFSFRVKTTLRNEPVEFAMSDRILVMSNIQGNFTDFRKALIRYGVINKNFEWIFGNGHFVIIGNCLPISNPVTDCLWLIYSLEERAKRAGGYLHFILGPQELLNLNGDWRYLHPTYAVRRKAGKGSTAFYSGNSELHNWLRTKNVAEKIGDVLFFHADLYSIIDHEYTFFHAPSGSRYQNVQWLSTSVVGCKYERFKAQLATVHPSQDRHSWKVDYKDLNRMLHQFNVEKVVVATTTQNGIKAYFDSKLVTIDSTLSAGFMEGLLLVDGSFYKMNSGRMTGLI